MSRPVIRWATQDHMPSRPRYSVPCGTTDRVLVSVATAGSSEDVSARGAERLPGGRCREVLLATQPGHIVRSRPGGSAPGRARTRPL
ncbi:hypothetical protein GCM10009756_24630 [Pseudokineococcus marinus]